MGHNPYLRPPMIRKRVGRDTTGNGCLNFFSGEIWPEDTVELRKPATDVAGETDLTRHDLFDDYRNFS